MNPLAKKFYEKAGDSNWSEVLILSEEKELGWSELSEKAPDLPRGWFELSRIQTEDRIEFVRDFWLDLMPYHPQAHPIFSNFFSLLDDVVPVLAKKDEEWHPEMVYSLRDGSTFFRGLPPASEEDLREFRLEMGLPLPRDYLVFLRIHNGFGKLSELGCLKIEDIGVARQRVKELILNGSHPVKSKGRVVDPGALIPFYELFGLNCFQCFYADWYPGSEMGNVYLSGIDYTISDTGDGRNWAENLGFSTFSEWLAHYLEGMDLSL